MRNLTAIIRGLQEARAIPVQRIRATCRFFRPHAHDDAATPHHCDFVNAAFGDAALRLDCGVHEAAPPEEAAAYGETGGWGFEGWAAGDPAQPVVGEAAADACFSCHTAVEDQGFVFSTYRD